MVNAIVGLLATGGLSHKVGTVDAGEIRPDFDEAFLADVAAGRGETTPPVRGWVVLVRSHGLVVWALMEASIADFPALAPIYRASGRTILVLPAA